MQRYPWPGNVRELENCVERAVVLCRGGGIGAADLPLALLRQEPIAAGATLIAEGAMSLEEALTHPERQIIRAALSRNNGNRQATAAELKINRTTLYKKMKRYDLFEGAAG